MSDVISTQAQGQPARVTRLRLVPVKKSNVVEHVTKYMNYYDAKGTPADRRDAEFFWEYQVRNRYSKDNPNFDRLLSQIKSPANEEFWAQRTDPAANQLRKQHDAQSGFWAFPRQLTDVELKADPGLLLLGDNSRSFHLPTYNLRPLTAIEWPVFVITLVLCNESLSIDHPTMVEVWSTLVQKVYHFEKDDVKFAKLREADFCKWTLDDAGTSTATIVVGQQSEEQLKQEQQLKQEIAMLKGETAQFKHKIATVMGQIRSRGLK